VKKPYAFTFWQSSAPPPAYISMCAETRAANLPDGFQEVHLDFQTCADWIPERDRLWEMSTPATEGRSATQEGRRWAIFCGMLRIALLCRYGGIWIDADTIVFRQFALLAPLVETHDLIASEYDGLRIANSVIGGKSQSRFFHRHWQAILDSHAEKRRGGDKTAHWGEYGDRMIRQIFMDHADFSAMILPFGVLIPFGTEETAPVFQSDASLRDVLPITAVGVSFYNNTVSDDIRSLGRQNLLASPSIFSAAYRLAVSGDDGFIKLSAASDFLPLNRAGLLRSTLATLEAGQRNLGLVKSKLAKRTDKVRALKLALKERGGPQ